MDTKVGVEQRRLRQITVHWGPQERQHLAMVPVFDAGYKVLGLVGLDAYEPPVWYPHAPLVVERRRMVFRSSLSDASPQWRELPDDLLTGAYFLDPWGAIQALVPQLPGAPSMERTTNLVGHKIRGKLVQDVVFEPSLHRVRAFMLRGRFGRGERVPVLGIPALRDILEAGTLPRLDAAAFGAPPQRPEGRLSQFVRRFVMPFLTDPRRRR